MYIMDACKQHKHLGVNPMKFFHINKNASSFHVPLLKILISIGILCLMFFRGKIIPLESTVFNAVLTILCIVLIGPCIMVVYLSTIEFAYAIKNRINKSLQPIKSDMMKSKEYRLSDILNLIYRNDIIEIEILLKGNVIRIGASSNWDRRNGYYYDKAYYFGECVFSSIDDLQIGLVQHGISDAVIVISIDGIVQS